MANDYQEPDWRTSVCRTTDPDDGAAGDKRKIAMINNSTAILDSAKLTTALAESLAIKGAKCPYYKSDIKPTTDQIVAEQVGIQKAAGGWTTEMANPKPPAS